MWAVVGGAAGLANDGNGIVAEGIVLAEALGEAGGVQVAVYYYGVVAVGELEVDCCRH